MKGPVSFLKANRVWGVLRGKVCVVSLFSSKDVFSVAALDDQAQQNSASLDILQNGVLGISKMISIKHVSLIARK